MDFFVFWNWKASKSIISGTDFWLNRVSILYINTSMWYTLLFEMYT